MSAYPPNPLPEDERNPYAAPVADLGAASLASGSELEEAAATRMFYLKHEASIKAVGALNVVGSVICLCLGVFFIVAATRLVVADTPFQQIENGNAIAAGVGVFFLVYGGFGAAVGIGLRRLQPWSRWTCGVLMAIQLLLQLIKINLGILVTVYFLYLMFSRKSAVVFSPEYKEVIAKTPHIRYKVSPVVKFFVALLLFVIGLAIVGGIITLVNQR